MFVFCKTTAISASISVVLALCGALGACTADELSTESDKASQNEKQFLARGQPEVQRQIAQAFEAFKEIDDCRGTERAYCELWKVKDLERDRVELVSQFAIFAGTRAKGEGVLVVRIMLEILEIADSSIIIALAPYVDAEDPELRSFVRDWFQYHDKASWPGPGLPPLQPVNYSKYKDYIRGRLGRNEPVPEAFVKYIYQGVPGHALLAFFYAHADAIGGKPLPKQSDVLWAEHVVSGAIWKKDQGFQDAFQRAKPQAVEHLQELSEHEQWWARLYVAEILRRHPEFRTPEMMTRLKHDEHELVRRAIARIESEAKEANRPVEDSQPPVRPADPDGD